MAITFVDSLDERSWLHCLTCLQEKKNADKDNEVIKDDSCYFFMNSIESRVKLPCRILIATGVHIFIYAQTPIHTHTPTHIHPPPHPPHPHPHPLAKALLVCVWFSMESFMRLVTVWPDFWIMNMKEHSQKPEYSSLWFLDKARHGERILTPLWGHTRPSFPRLSWRLCLLFHGELYEPGNTLTQLLHHEHKKSIHGTQLSAFVTPGNCCDPKASENTWPRGFDNFHAK